LDLNKAVERSMENPAFYVQYAHARIFSLLKNASERGLTLDASLEMNLSPLSHPREIRLMKDITMLPEVVEVAARERAPHKVATWLKALAASFHGFYHDCPVLAEGVDLTLATSRLALVRATQIALRVGLDLVGAEAVEEM
jgi:arginyl-tRNA synthetase